MHKNRNSNTLSSVMCTVHNIANDQNLNVVTLYAYIKYQHAKKHIIAPEIFKYKY